MRKFFQWLDNNLLFLISCFLLAFIPLYPKWPLFEAIPGYIVRVRLEDILISIAIILWLIWILRGKIKFLPNPLAIPIGLYLSIGLASMLSAVFITKTVPLESIHIGKMFLHWLRRLEYFSLFFIAYSSIKNLRQIKFMIGLLLVIVTAVTLYGYGQKYLYWPAFSTMNREFSKGWWLYLTQHARVLSTFGGHYDLAAYTMITLTILWSLFFSLKKNWQKILIFIILTGNFWLLILTASRTSFIAYLASLTVLFFLWGIKKGGRWAFTRWLAAVFLSIFVMLSFGDLSERFTKLLRIDVRMGGLKNMLFSPISKPPAGNVLFLENSGDISQVTSKSDMPPLPYKPGEERPIDVYEDIPLPVAEEITETGEKRVITRKRSYSQTAMLFDLSTSIRLDALWPRAWQGFLKNPLLGSGYSTLTKRTVAEFTEAESTDNDYLRSLGETGLLGFLAFYGIIFIILRNIWNSLGSIRQSFYYGSIIAVIAFLFGLLVNALYIDVFEASKVAFSLWLLIGITLGTINVFNKTNRLKPPQIIVNPKQIFTQFFTKTIKILKSEQFLLSIILVLSLILRRYKIDNPVADWHSWRQADTSAITRNFLKYGIDIVHPKYDDLSSLQSGKDNPQGYRFVEFPLYNLASVLIGKLMPEWNVEVSGRMASTFFSLGSILFLYLIVKKYLNKRTAFLTAFLFAVLPFNIYYSRAILPEPMMVMASLGGIYFFSQWTEKIKNEKFKILFYLLISLFFLSSAILLKPFAIFLFLPIIYLWFHNLGFSLKKSICLFAYLLICLLPFIWWRWWISHFPEGIPANFWLLNGDGIRFKGAWFYWLFAERLSKLILGYWGLPLFVFGIIAKRKEKEDWLFFWWLFAILIYLAVFATGNVRHDYYQIITIPIIAVFLAKGIDFLWTIPKECSQKIFSFFISIICFLGMIAFSWYYIRDFYNINHPEIVEAGKVIDEIAPQKALIIAPYNGDTAFLYQTKRRGWPIIDGSIDELTEKGAHYYISNQYDEQTEKILKEERERIKILKAAPHYIIIQLVPDDKLPKDE